MNPTIQGLRDSLFGHDGSTFSYCLHTKIHTKGGGVKPNGFTHTKINSNQEGSRCEVPY